jgi:hypothetical protein
MEARVLVRLVAPAAIAAALLGSVLAQQLPPLALNPQPLPPGAALNPQPLPPGEAINPQPLPPSAA